MASKTAQELAEDAVRPGGHCEEYSRQECIDAFLAGHASRDAEVEKLKDIIEEQQKTINLLANNIHDSTPQSMSEQSDEWKRMQALLAQAAGALSGVIAVADRKTSEFDAARDTLAALRAAGVSK